MPKKENHKGETDFIYEAMRLYNEEVNGYLTLISERKESLYTRAGLLIASASITTTFASSVVVGESKIAAMILGTVSAILGVLALWPRAILTHNLDLARDRLYKAKPDTAARSIDALMQIAEAKYRIIDFTVTRNKQTAFFIRLGFTALVAAIISAMV